MENILYFHHEIAKVEFFLHKYTYFSPRDFCLAIDFLLTPPLYPHPPLPPLQGEILPWRKWLLTAQQFLVHWRGHFLDYHGRRLYGACEDYAIQHTCSLSIIHPVCPQKFASALFSISLVTYLSAKRDWKQYSCFFGRKGKGGYGQYESGD